MSSTDYADACAGHPAAASWAPGQPFACPLLYDGVCDTTPHCCDADGDQWAGGDADTDKEVGGMDANSGGQGAARPP